jgi:branched-chain amino acid transport system permease protein
VSLGLQVVLNGLQAGAVYVLFAVGLTLIFGVMKIVNFAHGELFTGAAYITFLVVDTGVKETGLPVWLLYLIALVVAVAVTGLAGFFMYEVLFKRFAGDLIAGLLIAVGLSLILQVVYRLLFTSTSRRVPQLINGTVTIAGASLTIERLVILVAAVVVTVALAAFLRNTRLGISLRAVSEDREAAQLQGINYRRVARSGFMLGAVLAGVAAVLIAPVTVVNPSMGIDLLMKGFIIVILGGLGSIPGAIIAGLLLGLLESAASTFINVTAATVFSFVVVIAVLLIRPQGLLGRIERA